MFPGCVWGGFQSRAPNGLNQLFARDGLVVRDNDFPGHEVHPHFAHASQWFERALDGFDFIGAVHARHFERGLLARVDFGIQNGFARRFVMSAV